MPGELWITYLCRCCSRKRWCSGRSGSGRKMVRTEVPTIEMAKRTMGLEKTMVRLLQRRVRGTNLYHVLYVERTYQSL